DNRICLGNRGRVDVNVTIKGKTTHSGMPWLGLSAIEGAYEAQTRLRTLRFERRHPQLGQTQATVYQLTFAPIAPHTLPDADAEGAVAEIRDAIGDLSPYQVTVEKGAHMYPAEVPVDAPIVRALQA